MLVAPECSCQGPTSEARLSSVGSCQEHARLPECTSHFNGKWAGRQERHNGFLSPLSLSFTGLSGKSSVNGFLAEPVPSGARNDKMCWSIRLYKFQHPTYFARKVLSNGTRIAYPFCHFERSEKSIRGSAITNVMANCTRIT